MPPKMSLEEQMHRLQQSEQKKKQIIELATKKPKPEQANQEHNSQMELQAALGNIPSSLSYVDKKLRGIQIRYNHFLTRLYRRLSKEQIYHFQRICRKAREYISSNDTCHCTPNYYEDGRSCYCSAGTRQSLRLRCKSLADGLRSEIIKAKHKISDDVIQGLQARYRKAISCVEVIEESKRCWAERNRIKQENQWRIAREKEERQKKLLEEKQKLYRDPGKILYYLIRK